MKILSNLRFCLLLLLMWLSLENSFSQDEKINLSGIEKNLIVMVPTGVEHQGLQVFKILPQDDPDFLAARKIFEDSFTGYSIVLYDYVQQYLVNEKSLDRKEPAYLALTGHSGCFAVTGFWIRDKGELIDKSETSYIDLNRRMILEGVDKLESITQIFPHEMGHVIQTLLSGEIEDNDLPGSINMHYFSIVSDYRTAFSEGFAEHFENISRDNEKNQDIRNGIESDTKIDEKILEQFSGHFTRDYSLPFRMDFYRVICPLKYQQIENLKRYKWAENNEAKFLNPGIGRLGNDKYLLYRNTAIKFDSTRLKTFTQASANEGIIATFFYQLVNSECNKHYGDSSFYSLFQSGSLSGNFAETLPPLTNQYLKIFYVFHKYVKSNYFGSSILQQFIIGYIQEFPQEEGIVRDVFKSATGHDFINDEVPEIWLLAPDFQHSFWIMAQFGLKSPYYTFDLNAAEVADLMTLKDLKRKDAERIIQYRDSVIYFKNLNDAGRISGLSENAAKIILKSGISKMPEGNLPHPGFKKLLTFPLLHLGRNMLIWFIIFIIGFYFLYYKNHKRKIASWKFILMKFLNFILLAFWALVCVIISGNPWINFTVFLILILALKLLINRKNPIRRNEALLSGIFIGLIMIYSLI